MKYTTLKILVMLCLLVILTIASASAQSNGIRVNIPFDFAAGRVQLKAGEYIVRPSSEGIVVLRRINDRTDTFVFAPNTIQRPENNLSGKLVFHRYGNEYFLAELWASKSTVGRSVNKTGTERRLARQLATVKMPTELVEVTAALR